MYDRILQEDVHEDHRYLASRVLRWLMTSFLPLDIEELAEVCTIPPEAGLERAITLKEDHRLTLDQLLNLLPDLVVYRVVYREIEPSRQARFSHDGSYGDAHGQLEFAHFSVREYLLGPQLQELPSSYFRVQMENAHRLVAKECLAYLYLSRNTGSDGALATYASRHWQLHAVVTGQVDEDARKKAFFLSLSIHHDSLATLDELPEDFVRITQWLESLEHIHQLISVLEKCERAWRKKSIHAILAILYPQTGRDSTIRCKAHHVSLEYAPSYDVIYCPWSMSRCSPRGRNVSVNGGSVDVADETYLMLQNLRRGLTTTRLIWLDEICHSPPINRGNFGRNSVEIKETFGDFIGSCIYRNSNRLVVYLDEDENEEQESRDSSEDGGGSPFAPASNAEHKIRRLEDQLIILEIFFTRQRGRSPYWHWHRAVPEFSLWKDLKIAFLYGSQEFDRKDVCEMLKSYDKSANNAETAHQVSTAEALSSAYRRNRHPTCYQLPCQQAFPYTRAVVESWSGGVFSPPEILQLT
jgi:hypothetical protein